MKYMLMMLISTVLVSQTFRAGMKSTQANIEKVRTLSIKEAEKNRAILELLSLDSTDDPTFQNDIEQMKKLTLLLASQPNSSIPNTNADEINITSEDLNSLQKLFGQAGTGTSNDKGIDHAKLLKELK